MAVFGKWKSIAKNRRERRNGRLLRKARKEKRVKIIVAVSLVICVVFTVFGSVFIQYNMLKFAAIAAQRIEWTLRESRDKSKSTWTNLDINEEIKKYNGGLSGIGIDFENLLGQYSESCPERVVVQVLQLLDALSLEGNYPCVLLGLSLLHKESGFWAKGTGGYTGVTTHFKENMYDIYKYSADKRYPEPPSKNGGGKVFHSVAYSNINSAWDEAKKAVCIKDGGYYNHGAYGIVQVEADKWISDPWTQNGVSAITTDNSHLVAAVRYKAFVENVLGNVGHSEYISEFSNSSGKSINNYEEYIRFISNAAANTIVASTYSMKNDVTVVDELEMGKGNTINSNADEIIPDYCESMSEEEKNVFQVICDLMIWNGGNCNILRSDKVSANIKLDENAQKFFVDLSKYLVANGADDILNDTAYYDSSNKITASEKQRDMISCIVRHVYGEGEAYNSAYNDAMSYWNNKVFTNTGVYAGQMYALCGIIEAQRVMNRMYETLGLRSPISVYTLKYTGIGTANLGSSSQDMQNAINRAIEYIDTTVKNGAIYSQVQRMNEGYYDCSSLIWRAFKETLGIDITQKGSSIAPCANEMARTLKERDLADVLYEGRKMSYTDLRRVTDGNVNSQKQGTEVYGAALPYSNGVYNLSALRRGDLIFWDYSTSWDGIPNSDGSGKNNGEGYMRIDHVGIFAGFDGNSAMIYDASSGQGKIMYRKIWCPSQVCLVLRLNDSALGIENWIESNANDTTFVEYIIENAGNLDGYDQMFNKYSMEMINEIFGLHGRAYLVASNGELVTSRELIKGLLDINVCVDGCGCIEKDNVCSISSNEDVYSCVGCAERCFDCMEYITDNGE